MKPVGTKFEPPTSFNKSEDWKSAINTINVIGIGNSLLGENLKDQDSALSNNNRTSNIIDSSQSKKLTTSSNEEKKNETDLTDLAGFSSELTSLEKRLLQIDKTKAALARKPMSGKTNIQPPSSAFLDLVRKKKLIQKQQQQQETRVDEENKNQKAIIEPKCETFRRSFWDKEPIKHSTSYETNNNDESDSDYDDIVIVTKRNLSMSPIRYSKQFYDSNINGLESAIQQFESMCQPLPIKMNRRDNALLPTPSRFRMQHAHHFPVTNTTHTTTKLASKTKVLSADEQRNLKRAQQAGLLLPNRQRYIHHIVTSIDSSSFSLYSFSPYHVDNLKNFYNYRYLYAADKRQRDDAMSLVCFEINAAGFRCIYQQYHQLPHPLNGFSPLVMNRESKTYSSLKNIMNHHNYPSNQQAFVQPITAPICYSKINSRKINRNFYANSKVVTNKSNAFQPAITITNEDYDYDNEIPSTASNNQTNETSMQYDDYNLNYDQIEQQVINELLLNVRTDGLKNRKKYRHCRKRRRSSTNTSPTRTEATTSSLSSFSDSSSSSSDSDSDSCTLSLSSSPSSLASSSSNSRKTRQKRKASSKTDKSMKLKSKRKRKHKKSSRKKSSLSSPPSKKHQKVARHSQRCDDEPEEGELKDDDYVDLGSIRLDEEILNLTR